MNKRKMWLIKDISNYYFSAIEPKKEHFHEELGAEVVNKRAVLIRYVDYVGPSHAQYCNKLTSIFNIPELEDGQFMEVEITQVSDIFTFFDPLPK